MLRWPDREAVDRAVRALAEKEAARRSNLLRLGYFGSYARGDWGPGSDVDLVAVVREDPERFDRRALAFGLSTLPVPAELRVCTQDEWDRLMSEDSRLSRTLGQETVWVLARGCSAEDAGCGQ